MENKKIANKQANDKGALSSLPIGAKAKVLKVMPTCLGKKKFADIGIIPGTELVLEAQAPFGGLLRVKVLDSSLSLHKEDARHIIVERK